MYIFWVWFSWESVCRWNIAFKNIIFMDQVFLVIAQDWLSRQGQSPLCRSNFRFSISHQDAAGSELVRHRLHSLCCRKRREASSLRFSLLPSVRRLPAMSWLAALCGHLAPLNGVVSGMAKAYSGLSLRLFWIFWDSGKLMFSLLIRNCLDLQTVNLKEK